MSGTPAFGVSTHLFHGRRLTREHLLTIGAHGFEKLEVCATRSHFDYHNPAMIGDLQQWLAESGLVLESVHAPVGERFAGGRWSQPYTLASADTEIRTRAVEEAERALHIARRIPYGILVTHLGVARTQPPTTTDNSRDGARRSIEALQEIGAPLGVRIAVEIIANELSQPGSLVHFVEDVIEPAGVGICLDFGHAHIDGDLLDAIDTVSEHLIATHLHDNRGRRDDHLVPFDGSIDWAAALTAVQKVGYDGTLMFEVGANGSEQDTLKRAQRARGRFEQLWVSW